MLQVGELLDNKYKILSEIGHGGMSVVYLAINERANKTWAVKEVRKNGTVDFEAVKQGLVTEIELLKKLRHPHLPSIVDIIDTSDSYIIVMDYIEGKSFQTLISNEGPQPEDRVIKWAKQMCDVVGYLHSQNMPIIYRDLKPANVMLKPDDTIALIDFGTAREFKNQRMAEDTICLGTRGYAAPEQFGGRGQTDARTDIYCLGATIYHLISGHSPAEPPYEIKPLRYWKPEYAGSGLEKLILKCTRQDPNGRYRNCEELMYALEHYRDEDDLVKKDRRRKWNIWLACMITGLAGLAGTIGFGIGIKNENFRTYEAKIAAASRAGSLNDAEALYRQALEIDPSNSKAYESIFCTLNNDIVLADGRFENTERAALKKILTASGNDRRQFIDILKEKNPKEYADISYKIGILYFFFTDGSAETLQDASANYFKDLTNPIYGRYLDEGEKGLSELLYLIGGYYGNLGSNLSKAGLSEAQGSYRSLYEGLCSIADGNLSKKVGGNTFFTITIYNRIALWVGDDFKNFIGNDITAEQLLVLLDKTENGLNNLTVGDNDKADLEKAESNVEFIKEMLKRNRERKEE